LLNHKIKLGELFCGPGGMSQGAKDVTVSCKGKSYSFDHVWALDNDSDSCATYAQNLKPKRIINEDIRSFNKKLKNKDETLEYVDAIAFGFPCNDFSNLGEKNGLKGKYGPLYTEALKIVQNIMPKFFVAENVTGIRSADRGNSFEIIKKDMSMRGKYQIYSHLYKFEEYGVPQTRHRFIIIGIRSDLNIDYFPPAPLNLNQFNNCKKALSKIPKTASNHEHTKITDDVRERLKNIKPGFNAFNSSIPKKYALHVKGAKLSNIYKRLDPSKPAYTVTGSGGGGTKMYHWKDPRPLTNRERARLQTFRDNFKFIGKSESVRRQVGMAVPPLAAKIIFTSIVKTLLNQGYNSINPNDSYPQKLSA